MKLLFRLAGAALVVILSGCALQGNGMAGYYKRAAAERLVQNQTMTTRMQARPLPLENTLKLDQTAMVMVDVPAAFASAASLICARSFSIASEFLRLKYSSSNPRLRSSIPSPISLLLIVRYASVLS